MSKVFRDWFAFPLLCSVIGLLSLYFALWLVQKTRATLSPIRYKTKTTRDLVVRVLPRFRQFVYIYIFFKALIGSSTYFPFFWLAVVIALVFCDTQSKSTLWNAHNTSAISTSLEYMFCSEIWRVATLSRSKWAVKWRLTGRRDFPRRIIESILIKILKGLLFTLVKWLYSLTQL